MDASRAVGEVETDTVNRIFFCAPHEHFRRIIQTMRPIGLRRAPAWDPFTQNLGHARNVPQTVVDALAKLMQELSLSIAAADFVVDNEGCWHFIELNPSGAFLFIQDRCPELNVLQALASLLRYGAVADGYESEFPSLAIYQTSSEHTRWRSAWERFISAAKYARSTTYLDEM